MPQPSDMKGRAALVTGAASGLGRATALKLARAGADVCLVDINAAGLEEAGLEVRTLGVRAVTHPADISSADSCRMAVTATLDAFGRLDALCNVAGILVFAHTPQMTSADWEKTLAINLTGPFHLIQAAIPHLLEANGAVVNVTSSAAFVGEAYLAAYCATKAGLTHMTKALAMEYAHQPIRFNAVAPGGMMTGIVNGMKMPDDADFSLITRFTGLRGMVEVEEVAEMIAVLASPAAEGYHGACISIDKGITAG
ncbi:SDR family NAD(P)-dependent oxidoreductase [Phenylobacterium sp. LjRoot219]|uniref:SDR family NAD(P)-dependent oxidoreductase n=1 Tax=Phenylobacterium sp. LjRoot219 TaxID=3342283 RepID=UPI003ED08A05